jgi:F-box associated protein
MTYRQSNQVPVQTRRLSIPPSGSNGDDGALASEQGPNVPDSMVAPGTTATTDEGFASPSPEPQVIGCADAQPSPEVDRDLAITPACIVEAAYRSSPASLHSGSLLALLGSDVLDWGMGGGNGRRGCSQLTTTPPVSLSDLPNEILFHILSFLDVSDLLTTSRVSAVQAVSVLLLFAFR